MDVRVGPLRKLSTEERRTDAFELWCWRRLLRVPWTARWSNHSILKKSVLNIHWKGWCWSWSSNSLATWCEELTHWKIYWFWERQKARRERDDRGWDGWMASLTQLTWVWASFGSCWWTGKPGCDAVHGVAKSWTWLSDWTELMLWLTFHAIHHYCKKNWGQVTAGNETSTY